MIVPCACLFLANTIRSDDGNNNDWSITENQQQQNVSGKRILRNRNF